MMLPYYVSCMRCECFSGVCKTEEEAIELWNKENTWNDGPGFNINKKEEDEEPEEAIYRCLRCHFKAEMVVHLPTLVKNGKKPYCVRCTNCSCGTQLYETRKEAIEVWNRNSAFTEENVNKINKEFEEIENSREESSREFNKEPIEGNIRPCVRCGSEVEINSCKDGEGTSHYYIRCESDKCCTSILQIHKTRKRAIERWNKKNPKKKEEYSKNDEDSELEISQNGGIIKCLLNFIKMSISSKAKIPLEFASSYVDSSFEGFLFKISLQEILDYNRPSGKFLELLKKLEEGWEIIMFTYEPFDRYCYILLGKPKLKN